MKKILVAMLMIGIAGAAIAQNTYSLQGSLVDSKGQALPFTNCVLLKAADSSFAYGTTSDLDGVFAIGGIKPNSYILRISAVGHEAYWQELTIAQDTNLGIIEIADNATLLQTVQITASRPLYSADGEKVFYNVGDDPSVQSGNATDALQNAPGVEVDAEGNIKYRGGAEVSIWINNKPSHLKAESLKQYLKSLPAGTLQRIEVIAHPSAKYHTQNCVVNIVTTAKVKRNELLCLGLNATLRPADFMNIRFYANLFDDYYRVQYRPGKWAESEMLCYSLRLNFWAKLWEHNGVKWFDGLQVFANAVYRSRTQTLLAEVDPYFTVDCGVSTDLFDRRLSLFLNVNDIFGTVRTGGESVNPYNPSTTESTLTSQYVSFGLTWRLGRTEMEGQQTHGRKSGGKRNRQ